jgi:hypothetical protein
VNTGNENPLGNPKVTTPRIKPPEVPTEGAHVREPANSVSKVAATRRDSEGTHPPNS